MNLSGTVHSRKCNLLVLLALVLMCAPVIAFGQMNWLSATSSAEFGKRALLHAVVYNNKMWVLHGWDLNSDKPWADVWCSTTGKNWTRSSTDTVPHEIRVEFAALDFNGYLWVLGGNKGCWGAPSFSQVWQTNDGIKWTMVTGSAGFGARRGHGGVVFDNKMWVLGGLLGGYVNDVWSSSDGKTWTQATASAQWSVRFRPACAVFNNKMWIMGGHINKSTYYNDVWSSSDGKTWTQATAKAGWSVRAYSQVVVFNNKMWLFGGDYNNGGTVYNDVWSSSDGATWTQVTAAASWPKRATHAAIVYDNKAWVIAGAGGAGSSLSDVWSYDIPTGIQNNGKPVSPAAPVTINTIRSNASGSKVTIHYALNRTESVKIGIYTCTGKQILTLMNEVQNGGAHTVEWNKEDCEGKTISTGAYFVRFVTCAGDVTRKIVIGK